LPQTDNNNKQTTDSYYPIVPGGKSARDKNFKPTAPKSGEKSTMSLLPFAMAVVLITLSWSQSGEAVLARNSAPGKCAKLNQECSPSMPCCKYLKPKKKLECLSRIDTKDGNLWKRQCYTKDWPCRKRERQETHPEPEGEGRRERPRREKTKVERHRQKTRRREEEKGGSPTTSMITKESPKEDAKM